MKKFKELRKELKEDIFSSAKKLLKVHSDGPVLTSQQKKIMDGIKNILAKNSSEMNVQKANMTIDKYSRANPQVDDKAIAYMKKMISSYTSKNEDVGDGIARMSTSFDSNQKDQIAKRRTKEMKNKKIDVDDDTPDAKTQNLQRLRAAGSRLG